MRFWQVPESGQRWRRRLVYETIPGSSEQTRTVICEYTPERPMGDVPVETGVDSSEPEKVPKPVLRIGPVTKLDMLMPDKFVVPSSSISPDTHYPSVQGIYDWFSLATTRCQKHRGRLNYSNTSRATLRECSTNCTQ